SLKKGWRTPFSFKITPRRARRTGPQALFVGSLAEKRCFFAKLRPGTDCRSGAFCMLGGQGLLEKSKKLSSPTGIGVYCAENPRNTAGIPRIFAL
ncbi:MAG: hypothetical protein KHY82_01110, partial [Subdoligranulum sp.]|nr:hypothetical protein [Subdoligranulum sp.]